MEDGHVFTWKLFSQPVGEAINDLVCEEWRCFPFAFQLQMPSQSEAASDTAATRWLRLGLLRPGAMLHAVELAFQELVEHQVLYHEFAL